jgi:hypothetical protein
MRAAWVLVTVLGGCVGAGLYTAPDVLAPSTHEIEVVPEAWRLDRAIPSDPYFGELAERDDGAGGIPAMVARFGMANGTEIGVGTGRLDVKIPIGPDGSLAVDPLIRGVKTQDGLGFAFEAPVIGAVHLGDAVTLVANGGISIVDLLTLSNSDAASSGPATILPAVRAGAAVRVRIAGGFYVQPEVTLLHSFGTRLDWLTGGLALQYRGWK